MLTSQQSVNDFWYGTHLAGGVIGGGGGGGGNTANTAGVHG